MKGLHCSIGLLLTLLLSWSSQVNAHPLAPGLLALTEISENQFQGIWKLPNKTADRGALSPLFPEACALQNLESPVAVGTGRSQSFQLNCSDTLYDKTLGINGFGASTSGVLLRINFLNGSLVHEMLDYQNSQLSVPSHQTVSAIFSRYIVLGSEHLIQGIDHVLFVITLAILVGWRRQLFWTITLFTLGHSITLSLTALGVIHFPVFFIEAMIAFSIAWAAADIINRDQQGMLKRWPWLMSGSFGLLHGMGFAGALAEIGLPQQALTLALAAFNIGIEIGQLLVIAAFFAVVFCVYRLGLKIPDQIKTLTGYAIGIMGAVWFWQRLFSL